MDLPDEDVFDPARYLRRSHPLVGEPRPRLRIPDTATGGPAETPVCVTEALEVFHHSVIFVVPVYREGRIVDFEVMEAGDVTRSANGKSGRELVGRHILEDDPNIEACGLMDQYVEAYESGRTLVRGPFEYVGISERSMHPATVTVRAARAGDGLLVSWRFHDDEERMASRWEQAERMAGLGWAEWNLFTDDLHWTPRMYEIHGRDPRFGPIRLDEMAALVLPEDREILEQNTRALFEYRESVDMEYRIRHRSGVRHLRVMHEPVLDRQAQPVAIRTITQDVTPERRRERDLATTHERMLRERRRAEEERRFALRLREAVLPLHQMPRGLPGLEIALRYLTTERIGGDWYKARLLPDGRVLLAIGDAMGHGLAAAAMMAQMRAGLAGLAYTGAEPAQIMGWLNELVCFVTPDESVTGTAILGLFDPAGRELTWVNAGHPPPVLIRGGTAAPLTGAPGPLLGLEGSRYDPVSTRLEPDDVLLFYTDGIVDRRDLTPDQATATLLAAATAAKGGLDERLEFVLAAVGAGTVEDDVCAMAVRVTC